ncbi:glutathione S-transferase family protein [Paraburkholderia sabiae]|uniref:Glutathione S-transferase n=1 Tax=Paraburkholderia sabiae TaxID=273251 RepID=A0ABU9QAC7_9BURK|nr:glutathione S-transferase [Paraburkholderia sabiae]WJZ75272.1 glutathione S-transferase [Paraburkholderia sabiae]CAD6534050.1 putative GST-like protein YibF [Paraburkholderia sabiae]
MQLIGMMDSPYVRRVAISLNVLGLPFEHQSVSVFRHFDAFAKINPVVKAPTFFTDDGTMLIDSSLILDYLEHLSPPEKRLMPADTGERMKALSLIGFALAACEKTMQNVYEVNLRPVERQHQPWIDRVQSQLFAAYDHLEKAIAGREGNGWLFGERLLQPDITLAVVWRFQHYMLPDLVDPARYPALAAFSKRAEALPEFVAAPLE